MKRGKKMALLLGLLGVLLGVYALIGQMERTEPVSEAAGSYPLWPEGKTVSSLSWTRDGEAYSFSTGETVWIREGDETFPVNQSALNNMADRIENLTAVSELTDVAKPEDYGLASPAFTVTVKDEAGGETVYAMGDQTPFADGYYLSVSSSENIYVIESSLETTFDKTPTQLATMETMPEVSEVTRMTVSGALDVRYDAEQDAWTETATGEMLDSAAVIGLTETAKNLTWSELVATCATEEELNAWALDDAQAVRLTLWSGETAERTILLGGTNEDGDRYARLADSAMVYTFYGEDADALLEASADTLFMKKLPGMTIEQIGSMSFSWEGGEAEMTGGDSESSTMQGVVEQLASLEATQRVEIGEPGGSALTMRVTDAEGNTQERTFRTYDVDSYLMPLTDTHGVLVPAQDVDKLIRMLKQIP